MALLPWLTGKVILIETETTNTHRFWVEVQGATSFDFKPGQFVTLDLPIDTRPTRRYRSYSIASWPDGSNVFELLIVLNKTGAGTQYIFNEVQVGTELKFRGPLGVFVLPEELNKDLILICTGTGIAPFRSMVHYIRNRQIPHKNIYLIFGTREQKDLLYYEEMKELQHTLKDFYYLPTLSRQQWEGHTGYVHAIYEAICKEKPDAQFYLCGWKNMVDEARQKILDMGYDKKAIHLELYG
ncbi:MAG TPA: FAD-dependent oxidoreductase [Chitinophagaceae bacterium]|nr:FAD-dependent oxidoreductase [Chitinophagaceae bacterium]